MSGISIPEWILILLMPLLLLGGYKNIPELAKNPGESLGSFKRGHKESREDEPQGKQKPQNFISVTFY